MISYTYELEQLNEGDRSPELIERIIEKHKPKAKRMKELYDRYCLENLPVYTRKINDPMSVNNNINNDFFSLIIDTKVGFFAGTPVSYQYEEESINEQIQELSLKNRLPDLDAEVTKYAAICGYGARYIYIDSKTDRERIVNVNPWEVVFLGENGIDESEFAVRYYTVETDKGEELRAELHEAGKWYEYRSGSEAKGKLGEPKEFKHVFDYCPMWGYENNEELIGDAESTIRAIDGYDRTVSDVNSEIEAFRLAYLAFFGVEPPNEDEEQSFTETGVFYFRADGDAKQSAAFLTKTLNDAAIENHLNRLREDIHEFSRTPNMRDEAFGGTISGEAAKYKMNSLENKTATYERKFRSSTYRMFEILGSSFGKKKINIDAYKVKMTFTRNFPQNLVTESEIQKNLKGIVPDEVRLSLFSPIENVQDAMDLMAEEQEAYMELLSKEENPVGGGTNDRQGTGSTGTGKTTS